VEVKKRLVHLTSCCYSGEPSISSKDTRTNIFVGKNGDQIRWKYLWRENRHAVAWGQKFPCCYVPFCSDLGPT